MASDYLKKFAPVATHLSSPTSATKSAKSELMHRNEELSLFKARPTLVMEGLS